MTKKDKELLLKDLCARLPFGVKAKITEEGVLSYDSGIGVIVGKEYVDNETFILQCKNDSYFLTAISEFVPYLRQMSSMTKEEMEELRELCGGIVWTKDILHDEVLNIYCRHDALDWLLKHHFDTRGLIEMGLALEAPEGMYDFK